MVLHTVEHDLLEEYKFNFDRMIILHNLRPLRKKLNHEFLNYSNMIGDSSKHREN